MWTRSGVCRCIPGDVGAGEGGAGAPCVFQRLRLGEKALDGELARLVPRGGPNQRSDRRRQPAAGPRLPSRSAFAESRIPPPHRPPPSHHFALAPPSAQHLAMKRFCQTAAREHPLRARTAPSPVRQRTISGVAAPQSPAGVRTMGASVRQFGEKNLVPEPEEELYEVHHPEVKVL